MRLRSRIVFVRDAGASGLRREVVQPTRLGVFE
jgi:hypothetical protein